MNMHIQKGQWIEIGDTVITVESIIAIRLAEDTSTWMLLDTNLHQWVFSFGYYTKTLTARRSDRKLEFEALTLDEVRFETV